MYTGSVSISKETQSNMTRLNVQTVATVLRMNMRSTGFIRRCQSTTTNTDFGTNYARIAIGAMVSTTLGFVIYNINSIRISQQKLKKLGLNKGMVITVFGDDEPVAKAMKAELGAPSMLFNNITIKKVKDFDEIKNIKSDVCLCLYKLMDSDDTVPFELPDSPLPSNIKTKTIILGLKSQTELEKLHAKVDGLQNSPAVSKVMTPSTVSYVSVNNPANYSELFSYIPGVFFGLSIYLSLYGFGHIGWHIRNVKK